jgi:hypothetical protein
VADIYLRSTDGLDADNGSTWALAKALCSAAFTASAAGGRVFVSDNHAETQAAAVTLTSPGTSAGTVAVVCVDDTGDPVPPTALATTGSISNTGAFNFAFAGHAACYGLTVNAANSTNVGNLNFTSSVSWHWIFQSSVLVLRGSGAAARFAVGGASGRFEGLLELKPADVQFNATAHAFQSGAPLKWYGGTLTLGTAPTGGLVKSLQSASTLVEIRGVDLTNLGTNPLIEVGVGAPGGYLDVIQCKINSSYAVANITTGAYDGLGHARVRLHQCTGSDTNVSFNLMEKDHAGTVESTTARVRTGGATDGMGAYSHKLTAASNSFYAPLYSPRYAIPIFTVGASMTLTVEVFMDKVAAPTDQEIFGELEYLGTSGHTRSTFTDTRCGILSSAASLTSSSASWTGAATNPQPRKIVFTFTPQEVGVAFVRVGFMLGSANVMWIDPPQRAQVI